MEYLEDVFNNVSNMSTTTFPLTTNSIPEKPEYAEYWGFIAAAVAVLFYGSNFVPIKKYETGDGMFFQWVLCSAIFMCGLILQIIKNSTFYPLALLGGVIWATGNICVVPIVKTIGLGLGLCIWATTNLIAGWATGTFGLFGTQKAKLANEAMNYAGVALAGFSAFIYVFVKSEVSSQTIELTVTPSSDIERHHLLNSNSDDLYSGSASQDVLVFSKKKSQDDATFIDKLSPKGKYIFGVVLSLVSGIFYGNIFSPSLHIQHNYKGASQDSLDYVFATFCGIYLTSSFYFIIYCAMMKNKPRIYPEVILPGLVSGIMWAVATGCWFVANVALKSEAVSFPIVSTCPPIIAVLFWGCFVFKEIKGRRNILILLLGCSFSVTGAILAGVSAE